MYSGRIDVHAHYVPSLWGEALWTDHVDLAGWPLPEWTPDLHLRFMDDNGIALSVLSLSTPNITPWQGDKGRNMSRRINEYSAELQDHHRDRFAYFATLPLPNVESAIQEAEYALKHLQATGVVLMSNYGGVYLGDKRYQALWEVLNTHSAIVFIHPTTFPYRNKYITGSIPAPIVEFPCDTTINAVHMVYNGVLRKYPQVKIILSHAGGFIPYAALRVCMISVIESHNEDQLMNESAFEPLLSQCKLFYFDTALSSGKYTMPSLLTFADPERILFGSDFPFAPEPVATAFTQILDNDSGLTPAQEAAINYQNAHKLLH